MGGARKNELFQQNCIAWNNEGAQESIARTHCAVRLGPITGAVENIGWHDEPSFYHELIHAAYSAGINVTAGDGYPDIKLQSGIAAIKSLPNAGASALPAVFIKPYDNARIFERINWCLPAAKIIGIDIDSYDIVTMRNLVQLEKKTTSQLCEIKKHIPVRFAIKGVILDSDIPLIQTVKPDIVVVSNHGGRVDRGTTESPLHFFKRNFSALRDYCGEIWIDGGIRTREHIQAAAVLGISEVMLGRPFITALCRNGKEGVVQLARRMGI